MAYDPTQIRISQLTKALEEAERFKVAATAYLKVLRDNSSAGYGASKEGGAMKRASMDLSRALPCLRKTP